MLLSPNPRPQETFLKVLPNWDAVLQPQWGQGVLGRDRQKGIWAYLSPAILSLLPSQNKYLEATVTDAEQQGELALKDTQAKLLELSKALQQGRDDWAQLLRDCPELLRMKLALDVELASSCRLQEGEECR